ncbi:hypothetical protein [Sutcliffiella rhizosphaerae]|uniref:Uncharacterized protein n=1 Tax=Sutcliffiella rhizosphaerae TaxID=2880967 RepID=A0ABM8YJF6_9BACI|nr:hypothetical protein [Sutcliffiella rhizosphaerae]CAG9619941.1 hypothetical protein BACCIP111883_00709 [Sutcliffiella rhizosphaerae]
MRLKWTVSILAGILFVTGFLLSFNEHVRGAVKLAFSTTSVVTISTEDETRTVMTKMNDGAGFQVLLSQFEENGWLFEEQMGSTFFFTKGDESLIIMFKMWTNNYIVAEMTEG